MQAFLILVRLKSEDFYGRGGDICMSYFSNEARATGRAVAVDVGYGFTKAVSAAARMSGGVRGRGLAAPPT